MCAGPLMPRNEPALHHVLACALPHKWLCRRPAVACRVALTAAAHLLPGKYPAHRRELLIIVAAHYVVAAASAAFMWLKGKDAFAHLCAGGPAGATPVSMQLKYPRYAQTFQLRVVSQDRCASLLGQQRWRAWCYGKVRSGTSASRLGEMGAQEAVTLARLSAVCAPCRSFESEKGDVASFFHSDGFLARDKFAEWVAGVLDQFKKQTRAQRLKAQ